MITQEIKLIKFEELREEAQNVAIENQIKLNQDSYFDFSWLEWQFEDEAKEKGFENPKFQYSLSYSQGDGLSFSFDYFNSEKLAEIIKKLTGKNSNWFIDTIQNSIYNLYGTGNTGRYCYAMGEQVKLKHNLFYNHSNIQRILEQVLEEIEINYLELCNKFEKMAYEAYEYELSEEKARFDLIEFNEQFLETGEQF
jgi:hypothetical protein